MLNNTVLSKLISTNDPQLDPFKNYLDRIENILLTFKVRNSHQNN